MYRTSPRASIGLRSGAGRSAGIGERPRRSERWVRLSAKSSSDRALEEGAARESTPPHSRTTGTKPPTKECGCPYGWTMLTRSTKNVFRPSLTSLSRRPTCRGACARCTCGTRTDTCFESARVKRKPTKNSEDSRRRLPHLRTMQVSKVSFFRGYVHRGFDVVVHAEEIRWVVLILQGDEAVVIRAVGFTRDGLSLVGNIISVGARYQKRLHGTPALSRPLNVFFRIGGTFPVRPNHQIVRVLPM